VEHLLKVAAIGDAGDAPFLLALKGEHGWSDTGREGRKRVVPFGRWADTVCRFLQDGYPGLVQAAEGSYDTADYCISVIEELKTAASVSALLAIGGPVIARPPADIRRAVRLADGFNRLLSFKGAPAIAPTVEGQVREFLHRLLAVAFSEVQRAFVVCALRGVGNAESATLIETLPPFRGSWAGLEQTAIRQIKQRLRRAKGGRG
jgi:hypothetical protein